MDARVDKLSDCVKPFNSIRKSLTEAKESISIEQFLENVADLKNIIFDKIKVDEDMNIHRLPDRYNVLEEKRYKDTMRILLDSHPESESFGELRRTK